MLATKPKPGSRNDIVRLYLAGRAKVCNCSKCRRMLLGSCHRDDLAKALQKGLDVKILPPLVAGWVKERPRCRRCFALARQAFETGLAEGVPVPCRQPSVVS